MSDSLQRTFDFLATSANEFAVPVLLHGLDVREETVRTHAVAALLRRGEKRVFAELIRRYDALPAELRRQIEGAASRMRLALRDGVVSKDAAVRANSLRIIETAGSYSLMETLLPLGAGDGPNADAAMHSARALVDRLFDSLSCREIGAEDMRARQHTRQQVLAALSAAVAARTNARRLDDLLAAILIVGEPGDAAVLNLLEDGQSQTGLTAWRLLESGAHPGFLHLLVSLLTSRPAPERLLKILAARSDPEFVLHLLRNVPDRFPETLVANLRRVQRLPWIDPVRLEFDWIPPGLQGRLVTLVSATGLDRETIVAVQQWVVNHGSVIGRMTAVESLVAMHEDGIETAIAAGLRSEDADVQAWATSRLREHHIPAAFTLLIERLDSPLDEVRTAAREELESFDLHRMLDLYSELKPDVCRRAGELIQKIDPETVRHLESELRSPIRRNRIRAVQAARSMGLHAAVADVLVELLSDDDQTLLRAVIDALADLPLPNVRDALSQLLGNENPRIQQAAEQALKKHASRSTGTPR